MDNTSLITGGAGFIGSHLAERLIQEGHNVVVLDNLSTGHKANLNKLLSHPRFRLVVGDVTDVQCLAPLVRHADVVFHLAASVGVKLIVEKPLTSMMNNLRGTEVVLEQARRWHKRILLASTSEVYGKNPASSFAEDDDLVYGNTSKTRWSYACAKAMDEFMAIAHYRESGLPVSVVRFFNTVGARQSNQYGMVLPTFVSQALRNEPITVHGTGLQSRTFTHINDTVDATYRLAMHSDAAGEVYNIGGSTEISIIELAKLICRRLKSTSRIDLVPYEQAFTSEQGFEDMPRRVPNCDKLDHLIKFQPQFTLTDMIDSVADYYRPVRETAAAV